MYKNKKIIAIIPARGGSKGIPNKNIVDLCGKPLIQYSIDAAQNSKYIDKVIVSTDSEKIAEVSRKCGANVPFLRPESISGDVARSSEVVIHGIDFLKENYGDEYDYVILLQPTSPLRTAKHIDKAIELCINSDSSSLVSVKEVNENPIIMRTIENNKLNEVLKFDGDNLRRQDLPKFYIFNGAIYITTVDFIKDNMVFVDDNTLPFIMEEQVSIDIDNMIDLKVVEYIINETLA